MTDPQQGDFKTSNGWALFLAGLQLKEQTLIDMGMQRMANAVRFGADTAPSK